MGARWIDSEDLAVNAVRSPRAPQKTSRGRARRGEGAWASWKRWKDAALRDPLSPAGLSAG